MNVDITVLVGLIGTVAGIVLGIWKNKKDGEKLIKEDTVQDTVMATKIDYISDKVDDIWIEFKAQGKELQKVQLDQAKLESSIKSAHHRIDELIESLKKEGFK